MTNIQTKIEEAVRRLRTASAGWGFVTDESIKMFEEQFVIPDITQIATLAAEEEREKLMKWLEEARPILSKYALTKEDADKIPFLSLPIKNIP